ncbi:MAG: proline--tRNA ligase [Pseudomonadota bacterium]
MRMSQFFLPVMRDTPKEAEIVSHQLMLRAGMVRQSSAGIYSWLPLGFRVLKKIEQIVREEQDRAGALEVLMPTIQPADLWRESGRYDAYGPEMLRIRDRHDRDMLYGPTNEEQITQIFRDGVKSYRELPRNLYHIQWKFRDEVRPRFGVMRGREFLMKDAYSFDLTPEAGRISYNKMFVAYLRTFARMELTAVPMVAETGPIGGNLSHEFLVLAKTGESQVYCHADLLDEGLPPESPLNEAELAATVERWTHRYAATDDKYEEAAFHAAVPEDKRISARGIEVGHIFFFGTKYSEPLGCEVQGPDGAMIPIQSGSYGIGVSRLAGGLIEANHDDDGIIWPASVAPFHVGIVNLKSGDAACDAACEALVDACRSAGIETLYDDRDERAGAKFTTMDLIGLPYQVIVGPKGLKAGELEVKTRRDGARQSLSHDATMAFLTDALRAVARAA